ncbi:MAG: SPFH domain-containing protein [Candidatus Dependentiae bacterium]
MIYIVILMVGLAIILLNLISGSFYLVRQGEVIVIERLGKMHKILPSGLHCVVPFIDNPRSISWTYIIENDDNTGHINIKKTNYRIDMRESVFNFPKQNVITKDNVTMQINAILYYRVENPKAALYEVEDLPKAIEMLTQTTLRNVIGSMDLDETLVSRDYINEKLRLILEEAADKWGVKVTRVELQEVTPPQDIRNAMEKQMRAERDRRATILEAEGKKQALILEAEGLRESQILQAYGQAQARLKIAQAEAEAINALKAATGEQDFIGYLIATQYVKALSEMTHGKNNKVVVVPFEASALMGSFASIKKIFNEVQ